MVNRIVITGRLTADPELRTTATGKDVCSFSVAVQKRFKPTDGSPEADFFRVTAWGPTANYVYDYFSKGRLIGIDGRLQSRKYSASDGTTREIVEIVAENVVGLDRPKASTKNDGGKDMPLLESEDPDDPFSDQ